MADVDTTSVPVIAVTFAIASVVLLFVIFCNVTSRKERKDDSEDKKVEQNGRKRDQSNDRNLKSKNTSKPKPENPKTRNKATFSHPWLCGSLKGHGTSVCDFDVSPNGKYIISCGDDRSLFLWNTKDFTLREHKCQRGNIELDHATHIKFSPDSKALVVSLANGNVIRIIKIGKKPDGSFGAMTTAIDFDQHHNQSVILSIGIASTGKFIMASYSDTTILVFSLKGEVLATIETRQMNNTCCAVSPCGRFIASAGFTPDIKVWEVCFDKGGDFKEVMSVFDLKGHKAGIHSFSFSNDSARVASVSKDGTWKLWDTSVEYKHGQDPKLLYTGQLSQNFSKCLIALSPDARTVAIAHGNSLSMYDCISGDHSENINDVHQDSIRSLAFDNTGHFLLTCGDRHLHILHNVPGYKATIADLQEKHLQARNHGAKERFQQQINEAKTALNEILGSSDE